MGSYGWIEGCVDGEDKLITKDTPLDFADTWPSERIRAGSLAYNFGATYAWMRLIDTHGMSPEQIEAHQRVYAGHCLMHDVMNAWIWSYGQNGSPDSALLAWGMNNDLVMFWPFWRNEDVILGDTPDVKVSAWSRTDRLLLCAMNYSKSAAATAEITIDLAAMRVLLGENAGAWNLEKPSEKLPCKISRAGTLVRVAIPARDYRLVAIGEPRR